MPGWHEATKELPEAGKLQMLGIIQEQHPDRCRLFMQWKQMNWPILVDSLDLLEIGVVPMTVTIDEHGIVRHVGLRVAQAGSIEESFLDRDYGDPIATAKQTESKIGPTEESFFEGRISDTIAAYEQALEADPTDGWSRFRLGVSYRARYDSSAAEVGDFQRAAESWSLALEIDPNNYIWRRRIQQYGPRLDKPYPFYDWVTEARDEIASRGEVPAALAVEPSGSEFAHPQRVFEATSGERNEPDPEGRITRDEGRFIAVESAAVPSRVAPGEATRVHFSFRPRSEIEAHWNNEVDDLELWIDLPNGWTAEARRLQVANPAATLSTETRRIEVELKAPDSAAADRATLLEAYALYYVCEDVDGTCLYRRQDVRVPISVVVR